MLIKSIIVIDMLTGITAVSRVMSPSAKIVVSDDEDIDERCVQGNPVQSINSSNKPPNARIHLSVSTESTELHADLISLVNERVLTPSIISSMQL